MVYVREFEFVPDEGMISVLPCDMLGATCGDDMEDAVMMAADWLRIHALDALAKGRDLPGGGVGHRPEHEGGVVIAVAVEATLADVPAMTAPQAARELGVSTAREAQAEPELAMA